MAWPGELGGGHGGQHPRWDGECANWDRPRGHGRAVGIGTSSGARRGRARFARGDASGACARLAHGHAGRGEVSRGSVPGVSRCNSLHLDSSARIAFPGDRVDEDSHVGAPEGSWGFSLVPAASADHAAGCARLATERRRPCDQYESLRGEGGGAAAGGRAHLLLFHRRCGTPGRGGIRISKAGRTSRCGGCLLEGCSRGCGGGTATTSSRVSHFVAISETVRRRIARCYRRDSRVIQPPVDVAFYTPAADAKPRDEAYLVVSSARPVQPHRSGGCGVSRVKPATDRDRRGAGASEARGHGRKLGEVSGMAAG